MLYSTISFLARSLNGEESLKKLSSPYPDLHQNRIRSSLSHTKPAHQISSKYIDNFLRYPAHKQTNKQTERSENITSFTFGGVRNKSINKPASDSHQFGFRHLQVSTYGAVVVECKDSHDTPTSYRLSENRSNMDRTHPPATL